MSSLGCDGRRGSRVLAAALLAWVGGVVLMVALGAPAIADAALQQKNGACPPLNKEVCIVTCYEDYDCRGNLKCCKTQCAGSMCVQPVSPPLFRRSESGVCPDKNSTAWICGRTCSVDDDCRRGLKCCVHRCGGMQCIPALPAPRQPLGPPQPPALVQPPAPPQPPAWLQPSARLQPNARAQPSSRIEPPAPPTEFGRRLPVEPYPADVDPRYPGEPVRFY